MVRQQATDMRTDECTGLPAVLLGLEGNRNCRVVAISCVSRWINFGKTHAG